MPRLSRFRSRGQSSGSRSAACCPVLSCLSLLKPSHRASWDVVEEEEYARSRAIDKELHQAKKSMKREVKLLLLGAGESGKSTFLKQMRIIHGYTFDPGVLDEYREVIYNNIIRGMKVLIDARDKLGIPWQIEGRLPCGSCCRVSSRVPIPASLPCILPLTHKHTHTYTVSIPRHSRESKSMTLHSVSRYLVTAKPFTLASLFLLPSIHASCRLQGTKCTRITCLPSTITSSCCRVSSVCTPPQPTPSGRTGGSARRLIAGTSSA